ncbi:hypothetical protein QVD17_02339 [Tagetes erecta]|uniref:Uncharacterized protein n=1 Tax=Tagetes erecta TaxID=13708 RepID=A0AAD8L913_TARER|nr:hypothetical protein QVD17_02339 [Tagetes erecta]
MIYKFYERTIYVTIYISWTKTKPTQVTQALFLPSQTYNSIFLNVKHRRRSYQTTGDHRRLSEDAEYQLRYHFKSDNFFFTPVNLNPKFDLDVSRFLLRRINCLIVRSTSYSHHNKSSK